MPLSINNLSLYSIVSYNNDRSVRARDVLASFRETLSRGSGDFGIEARQFRNAFYRAHFTGVWEAIRAGGRSEVVDSLSALIVIAEGRVAGKSDSYLADVLNDCEPVEAIAGRMLSHIFSGAEDADFEFLVSVNFPRRGFIESYGNSVNSFRERDGQSGFLRFAETVPLLGGINVSYYYDEIWQVPGIMQRRIPASLKGACLRGAMLRGLDLSGGDFQGADLRGADLRSTDLRGADLSGANLLDARIMNTTLQGADLRGATLNEKNRWFARELPFVNMRGAVWEIYSDWAIKILFRGRYSLNWDTWFNHRNNAGNSLLANIAGLHESCRDLKLTLMREVVMLLDEERLSSPRGGTRLKPLAPSLGDILFDDPQYLAGHDGFADWLLSHMWGWGTALIDARLTDAALREVGNYVALRLESHDFSQFGDRSVAVFQVLHAMRARAAEAQTRELAHGWAARAEALQHQYCTALTATIPSLMAEGGVWVSEKGVLADDRVFPMISADGRHCVMMDNSQYRQLVLGDRSAALSEGVCTWDDLRCVAADAEGVYPASVSDSNEGATRGLASTVSVLDQFPLLRNARLASGAVVQYRRILALSGLEGALLDRFEVATQRRSLRLPLTDVRDQLMLRDIFATKYEARDEIGAYLTADHTAELQALWPDDSQKMFGFRLLCLAAVYTYYSSSRCFGTENESPNALRLYAEAFLHKVHEVAPELLPRQKRSNWVNRLGGRENVFTCTAALYDAQLSYLSVLSQSEAGGDGNPLREIQDVMIPLAWK